MKDGRVEIIPNDQGNRITPSYVAFTEDGERLIGDSAKNQLTSNPKNTIFDAKRLIGREWNEPSVQNDRKFFPFEIFNKKSKPLIKVETSSGAKELSAEEVSAMVLSKMKAIAEDYLGHNVTRAVVTVPACKLLLIDTFVPKPISVLFNSKILFQFFPLQISMMPKGQLLKTLAPLPDWR